MEIPLKSELLHHQPAFFVIFAGYTQRIPGIHLWDWNLQWMNRDRDLPIFHMVIFDRFDRFDRLDMLDR